MCEKLYRECLKLKKLFAKVKKSLENKLDEVTSLANRLQTRNVSLEEKVKILESELIMSNTNFRTFQMGHKNLINS